MENEVVNVITHIKDTKTLFTLCAIFIIVDIVTGYLKALKFKKYNSSVSRDGIIKKVGWTVALLLGWAIDFFVEVNIFLVGFAIGCIATEGISIYENLGQIGIKLPFKHYFEKLKEEGVQDEE